MGGTWYPAASCSYLYSTSLITLEHVSGVTPGNLPKTWERSRTRIWGFKRTRWENDIRLWLWFKLFDPFFNAIGLHFNAIFSICNARLFLECMAQAVAKPRKEKGFCAILNKISSMKSERVKLQWNGLFILVRLEDTVNETESQEIKDTAFLV